MATPIDDDTLQRFYDGDLSPLEEHSVQTRIEGDVAAQRRLAELAKLSELMQSAADELSGQLDSQALFAAIERRIDERKPLGFGPRLRVISGEWLEHRRTTLMQIVAASAVAAATLLVVTRTNPNNGHPLEGGEVVHGTRVENVDFGSSTGTVFEIEDRGVGVAVVWISEDEEAP